MNYSEMFKKSFSSVSPVKNDEELLKSVLERTEKTTVKRKINIKKIAAIAVVAAAILSLSVTAAANFDLAALFVKAQNDRAKELEGYDEFYYGTYVENFYPEISEINIPEAVTSKAVDTTTAVPKSEPASTPTIHERLIQEYDKLIECDGYDIQVKGYAFDGYSVQVFMDFIFDKNGPYYKNGEINVESVFDLYIMLHSTPNSKTGVGGGGGNQEISRHDNVISCVDFGHFSSQDYEKELEGIYALIIPGGLMGDKFEEIIRSDDRSEYSIPLVKPEIADLIYEKETEIPVELVGYGNATLKKLIITPMITKFVFDDLDFELDMENMQKACFITLKNGEVIDLSYGGSNQTHFGSGVYEIGIDYGSRMIVDVNEIKSVQIYNEIIEIE